MTRKYQALEFPMVNGTTVYAIKEPMGKDYWKTYSKNGIPVLFDTAEARDQVLKEMNDGKE